MCYIWEGKVERCQHSSDTEFQTLLKVVLNVEPARPTHQMIARMAQHHSNGGRPQPPRQNHHIDVHRNSMAENVFDREHALTHSTQPSSSRHNAPVSGMAQHNQQTTDANQPCSWRNVPLGGGAAQHDRQRTRPVQWPTSRHDSRIDKQRQRPDQTSSLRKDPRIHEAAPLSQQLQSRNRLASSRRDSRSDGGNERGQKEIYQDLSSSSRCHTTTELTDEEEHQAPSPSSSQDHPRKEDMEVLTAGMNKLPPPCWGDERVILPLLQEQLTQEEYFRRQDQQLDDIWGLYGKEREFLAAFNSPELEETWTPVPEKEGEEEKILERETPLWEEIWERSMLEGEAWMRDILDEDENWPPKAPEEAEIWTREPGGMLSAAGLKQILRVLTLQESQRDEGLERSDESKRAAMRNKG